MRLGSFKIIINNVQILLTINHLFALSLDFKQFYLTHR